MGKNLRGAGADDEIRTRDHLLGKQVVQCLIAQVSVTMEILRCAQNDTMAKRNDTVGNMSE